MFINSVSALSIIKNTKTNNDKKVQNISSVNYLTEPHTVKPSLQNLQAYSNISFKKLTPGLFKDVAAKESSPLWEKLIAREAELYKKTNDERSEFERDLTRILHSDAYKRMKGKAQVWALPRSATASTRLTHVEEVSQVARSIAKFMGLNEELVEVIAKGHDVGHTPFGHDGEVPINDIMQKENLENDFWKGPFFHEKNSLRVIDDFETKLNPQNTDTNLNLTYAVRDGITSHCGEVDENGLRPRTEYIDLRTIQKANRPQPFTWEGCDMKLADKIAYLGTDIEEGLNNKMISAKDIQELSKRIKDASGIDFPVINNSVLIHYMLTDLFAHSNPQDGLRFSEQPFKVINTIKKFNYEKMYLPKGDLQGPYADLAIKQIYKSIDELYDGKNTITKLDEKAKITPRLISGYKNWLIKYSNIAPEERANKGYANKVVYDIDNQKDYKMSAVEYITSLLDAEVKNFYEEIIFRG